MQRAAAVGFPLARIPLDYRIATHLKPLIAVMDGLNAPIRVARERVVFSLSECTVGLWPEIGAGRFLQRCPGEIGMIFALTCLRLRTAARIALKSPKEENMSDVAQPKDKWSAGDAYEPYVGRWSRKVAAEFVDWLDAAKGERWLDVGCGTGALVQAILNRAAPEQVVGVDPSEGYLDFARSRLGDPRVALRIGDACALPVDDETYDLAVAGLVLNFVREPASALAEMRRAVRPGGIVAVYVWDYAGEMQLMRRFWDTAAAIDPGARELDEGRRFPICKPEPLRALFTKAGIGEVQDRAIDVPTVFRDFDDYWSPFLGGQGPAPGYCVSLPDTKREAIREKLRAELPAAPDGSIGLKARAFAVRGVRPS